MVNVSFAVQYKCAFGQTLMLVGDSGATGTWRPRHGQRMRWTKGDNWTCNFALPAGSSLQCKYVIVDEHGAEIRWQEGSNMAVRVPATCPSGLPVEKYEVAITWCKTTSNFTARPLTSAVAAAAATVAGIAIDRTAPEEAAMAAAVTSGATPAHRESTAGVGPAAAPAAVTASAPPGAGAATAWMRARGGTDPRPAGHNALLPQVEEPIFPQAVPAVVSTAVAETPQAAAAETPPAAATAPTLGGARPSAVVLKQAQALRVVATSGVSGLIGGVGGDGCGSSNPATPAPAPSSSTGTGLAATLMQAAAASSSALPSQAPSPPPAFQPQRPAGLGKAHLVPAAIPGSPAVAPAPRSPAPPQASPFQLTPPSDDEPMSILLPSRRASSPPVKISLSSSFSLLMEMPARPGPGACSPGSASSSGSPGCSGGTAGPVKTVATAPAAAAAAPAGDAGPSVAPDSGLRSHPINISDSGCSPSPSRIRSATASPSHGDAAGNGPGLRPAPPALSSSSPSASSSSSSSSCSALSSQPRHPPPSSDNRLSPAADTPTWGLEYDMYAAAYGAPYMHTPFDLDAYAVYEHACPEPPTSAASALAASLASNLSSAVAKAVTLGSDLLESAMQQAAATRGPADGAHGSQSPLHTSPASTPPAEHSVASGIPLPVPATPSAPAAAATSAAGGLRSPSQELLTATAASTALALEPTGCASAAVPPTPSPPPHAPEPSAPSPACAPPPSNSTTAASGVSYRQVSRSSPTVSDWASRTLMDMSSTLLDDDEEEADDADADAAVAAALAPPSAPGELTSLLQHLGTALGHSVRMRCDGADAAASDLLELDRQIALAASKLYRRKDKLLTGWVRQEARRQLGAGPAVAAAAAGGGSGAARSGRAGGA